jgi:hypothetical protein
MTDIYECSSLLSRIKDTNLFEERVILHSKLSQHENSLNILIFDLKNFESAEKYCLNTYPTSLNDIHNDNYFYNSKRNDLFIILLKILFKNFNIDFNENIEKDNNIKFNIDFFIERNNFGINIINNHFNIIDPISV